MKKLFYIIFQKLIAICLSVSLLVACNDTADKQSAHSSSQPLTSEQALEVAIKKYHRFSKQASPSNGYPRAVENSRWTLTNWQSWTDGFFPGMLWNLSTVDDDITAQAIRWTLPLKSYATMASHDVGFIINNSFGKAYRITGDAQFIPAFATAANTLVSRYNPTVNATRSWDFGPYQFPVIMDNMMNLALLFDIGKVSNAEPYYSTAIQHAATTARHHIRANGSSYHLVDFSPISGEVVNKTTVQGLNSESTWSRGQAWGIYGFSLAAIESGDVEFLLAAEKMANYFINNLPGDYIPYWDFDINDTSAPRDSSAAAIAAAGLWMLANQSHDLDLQETYRNTSLNIIEQLLTPQYFNDDDDYPALLIHATGNVPGNKEVDTSLIYADYYLVEALLMQLAYITLPL